MWNRLPKEALSLQSVRTTVDNTLENNFLVLAKEMD